jgi:hypothetical protein
VLVFVRDNHPPGYSWVLAEALLSLVLTYAAWRLVPRQFPSLSAVLVLPVVFLGLVLAVDSFFRIGSRDWYLFQRIFLLLLVLSAFFLGESFILAFIGTVI